MNILFTLCGRAGSKGFKNKNLKNFIDAPLVFYSIAAIKLFIDRNSDKYDIDVVLNTDSKELMRIVQSQKIVDVAMIDRDESLGGDEVAKVTVIKDSLMKMIDRNQKKYDIVVDLDITSPLRTVYDVEKAVIEKTKREDTKVVFSVTDSRRNPYFNMVKEQDGYIVKAIAGNFTARQQAPVFYDMNASIYVYSPKALQESVDDSVFFNERCGAISMKDTGILDIDSEEDFELMQVIGKYLYDKDPLYNEVMTEVKELLL